MTALFIAFLSFCGTAFGSVATGFFIGCEFELTDGSSLSGYFETYNSGEYKLPPVTGFVTAPSGINLRDKPSAQGKALKKLPNNAQLIVLSTEGDTDEIEGRKAPWYSVKADGLEGYAFGGFVQLASQSAGASAAGQSYTYSEIGGGDDSPAEAVNGEFFMKKFVRNTAAGGESDDGALTIRLFKEIHVLNYLPKLAERTKCEQIERNSFLGVLDSDIVEVEKSRIRNVRVTGFREGDIAPVLVLNTDELARLQKPAEAFVSVERYPEGVVALVSYTSEYNTPAKLESLFRSFAGKRTVASQPADAEWWYPIYDKASEQEFRQSVLPKDVVLLLYHTQD